MEIICENCAYLSNCRKDKNKACTAFIFGKKEQNKPVIVKTNKIRKD